MRPQRRSLPWHLGVFLALLLGTSTRAATPSAVPPQSALTLAQFRALPPELQRTQVLQLAARQRKLRAATTSADTTPPTLVSFIPPPSARAGEPLNLQVAFSDELSGVREFTAFAVSGDGGRLTVKEVLTSPTLQYQGKVSTLVGRDLPGGRYFFDFAFAIDEAGNVATFDANALASAGNVEVALENARRGDAIPPTLIGGRLRTTRLSRSASHPGTTHAAFAEATLQVSDSGEVRTSGVHTASMQLCLDDQSACFSLEGKVATMGLSRSVVAMGGQPALDGVPPGEYHVYAVSLTDWAGQIQSYLGTRFGGETDFANLLSTGDRLILSP